MDLCGRWLMVDAGSSSRGLLCEAATGDWGTWRACSGLGLGTVELWFRFSRLLVFLPVALVEAVLVVDGTASSRSVSSRPTGRSWAACIVRAFAISMAAGFPRSVAARRRDEHTVADDDDAPVDNLELSAPTRGGCGGRGGLLDTGALPFALQKPIHSLQFPLLFPERERHSVR